MKVNIKIRSKKKCKANLFSVYERERERERERELILLQGIFLQCLPLTWERVLIAITVKSVFMQMVWSTGVFITKNVQVLRLFLSVLGFI
jgi:hypothetical protein